MACTAHAILSLPFTFCSGQCRWSHVLEQTLWKLVYSSSIDMLGAGESNLWAAIWTLPSIQHAKLQHRLHHPGTSAMVRFKWY